MSKKVNYIEKTANSFVMKDEFTKTNRYKRFLELVTEKMSDIITSRYHFKGETRNEVNTKSFKPAWVVSSFMKCEIFARAQIIDSYIRSEGQDEEKENSEVNMGFLRCPADIFYLPSSLLWLTDTAIYESMKMSGDTRYSRISGLNATEFITTGDEDESVKYALNRVCWGYIRDQAIADASMDESNWFTKVKEIPESDVVILMCRLYETIIPEIENAAYIYMEQVGFVKANEDRMFSAALRWNIEKFKVRQEAVEEKYNEECELSKEKSEKIRTLSQEIEELKTTVAELQKTDGDAKAAITDAEKSRQKLDSLQEKYDSLLDYINIIESQEPDEPLTEEEIRKEEDEFEKNLESDDEIRSKRVVFVRDARFSKYTMMGQLSEYFVNSRFTDTSISDKEKIDVVVLLTRYTKHPTYFAARNSARSKGIPYIQCNCTNVNKIIREVKSGEQAYVTK